MQTCVMHAVESGDSADKLAELTDLLDKVLK